MIARTALARLPGLLPPTLPFLTTPSIDLGVAAFAVGLALVAVVMLAGWPIARLIGAARMPRGVAVRPRGLVYRALVVAQVAVTVALAVAGALLGQSLTTVNRQHPGFAIDDVLVAGIALPAGPAGDAGWVTRAEQRTLAAIASLPNVRAVAAAYDHPLEANWSEAPTVLGDTGTGGEPRQVELRIVSPGYFEALDVELLDGRTLTERDAFDAPGAAVVNEAFAREVGGRVVGRRLRSGTPRFNYEGAPDQFEIVGVVSNERVRGLELPAPPAYYLSTRQFPQTSVTILARTAGDPLAAAPDVRAAIRAADSATTVERPTSLAQILADQLVARRVTTDLIGGFATAAVALAALGMYGLLAVLVSSRRRETRRSPRHRRLAGVGGAHGRRRQPAQRRDRRRAGRRAFSGDGAPDFRPARRRLAARPDHAGRGGGGVARGGVGCGRAARAPRGSHRPGGGAPRRRLSSGSGHRLAVFCHAIAPESGILRGLASTAEIGQDDRSSPCRLQSGTRYALAMIMF